MAHAAECRRHPEVSARRPHEENADIFDFTLTDDEMARIATLDTGASLFFDHRDPVMVKWLNERREP